MRSVDNSAHWDVQWMRITNSRPLASDLIIIRYRG